MPILIIQSIKKMYRLICRVYAEYHYMQSDTHYMQSICSATVISKRDSIHFGVKFSGLSGFSIFLPANLYTTANKSLKELMSICRN